MPTAAGHPPKVVVIPNSAGGLTALIRVLSGLPSEFGGAVLIVQHRAAVKSSLLEKILQRATTLTVVQMHDGQRIQPGTIYVAPPDRHARLTPDRTLELSNGRTIRHVRSSSSPLFESTAGVYGPDAIAVVLTGTGSDGIEGVQALRAHGGTVVAQDDPTSEYLAMARSAIQSAAVSYVLPIGEISQLLTYLVGVTPQEDEDEALHAGISQGH